MAVDALEIADNIEVNRAGLDQFAPSLPQAGIVTVGGGELGIASWFLFGQSRRASAMSRIAKTLSASRMLSITRA